MGPWKNAGLGQNVRRAVLAMVLSLLPAGCSSLQPGVKTSTVEINVVPGANNDTAVQVDIIAVYDQTLLQRLLGISAKTWFSDKAQITLDYPDGFRVWNWQLVPGTQGVRTSVSADSVKSYEILVFAGYAATGDHRARLGTLIDARVDLGSTGFTVTQLTSP